MYLKFWMTLRIVARNLCSSHFIKVPAVLGDERKQGGPSVYAWVERAVRKCQKEAEKRSPRHLYEAALTG